VDLFTTKQNNMKSKILYLILIGIIATLFFQACSKEEGDIIGNTEQAVLKDSLQVENRNGDVYRIAYTKTNSSTFHQNETQEAVNKDSLISTRYVRITGAGAKYTKKLGTLDPDYSNKPARLHNVTYLFKDSSTIVIEEAWVKDTVATNFTILAANTINLFAGKNKVYKTIRSKDFKIKYYDTNYQKLKDKFRYTVALDTTTYTDYLPASNTGTVFWLNHKM